MEDFMEKILVLSDIHAGMAYAKAALKEHPECKTVIFCGDGINCIDSLERFAPDKAFFSVMGNCDFGGYGVKDVEAVLEMEGHRIFICHGHTRDAKSGCTKLIAAAVQKDADIVLFGHTHAVCDVYDSESGVYLFNPGSIGNPHFGQPHSYGLLTLDKGNVLFSIGKIEL